MNIRFQAITHYRGPAEATMQRMEADLIRIRKKCRNSLARVIQYNEETVEGMILTEQDASHYKTQFKETTFPPSLKATQKQRAFSTHYFFNIIRVHQKGLDIEGKPLKIIDLTPPIPLPETAVFYGPEEQILDYLESRKKDDLFALPKGVTQDSAYMAVLVVHGKAKQKLWQALQAAGITVKENADQNCLWYLVGSREIADKFSEPKKHRGRIILPVQATYEFNRKGQIRRLTGEAPRP